MFGHQHARGAHLVDHVDGLVGQLAVVDVAGRELDGGAQGFRRVAHLVVLLEIGLEPAQDLDRLLDGRLIDVDLLEPAHQGPVLFEVVAVVLVGGRAHAAQIPRGERGLEDIGGVHGAAAGGAGADHGVDFVDEQDGAGRALQLRDDALQAFLEVAAIPGAGQQRSHVEGENGAVPQDVGNFSVEDAPRQALGDGGLAHTGLAHIERVVLVAPAQDLDGPLDLGLAPDERIDVAVGRLLVEVHAIGVERLVALLDHLVRVHVDVGPAHGARLGFPGHLGDAVGDVVDGVEPRHVVGLEEIHGMGFALGEQGDQHVGPGHLLAARRLHVNDGALDHALEAGGGFGVGHARGAQAGQLVIDELGQVLAQLVQIDAAGAQDGDGVLVLGQGQQKVLERGELVAVLGGQRQGPMERLFQVP